MAFLLPENLPSRNGVPQRLQTVARAARDHLPEEVTVWWRKEEDCQFLVLLDPEAGILVMEVPERSRRAKRRVFHPQAEKVRRQVEEGLAARGKESQALRVSSLPIKKVLVLLDVKRGETLGADIAGAGEEALFAEDLEPSAFREAIGRILSHQGEPLTKRDVRLARAAVNPEIVIKRPVRDNQLVFRPPGDGEDVFAVMDRKQERLAEHLGPGYRRIRGVAGSGKTLVLLHRARFIADLFPQHRVLLLCFNKALSRALQELVGQRKNVTVLTVDGLAFQILQSDRQNFNPQDDDGWAKLPKKALQIVQGGSIDLYHMVLVDEAQDLTKPHLDLAYAMVMPGRPEDKNFVVAYDSAQNIYRNHTFWNPPEMTARGRSTVMRLNYRNTREILDFAMNFLTGSTEWTEVEIDLDDDYAVVPPEAASRTGLLPKVTACADWAGEAAEVAKRVSEHLENKISPDEIAVIYGSKKMVPELEKAFASRNILFAHIYRGGKEDMIESKSKVRIANLYQFKGLEFGSVFICGANQVWVPGDDDIQRIKSLLYVGMTRARDELMVTYSGPGAAGEALQKALSP